MLLRLTEPWRLAANFQIGSKGTPLGETVQQAAESQFIPRAGPEDPSIGMLRIDMAAEGVQQSATEACMPCAQCIAAAAGCAASSTDSANATNWNSFFITLMMGAIDTRRL